MNKPRARLKWTEPLLEILRKGEASNKSNSTIAKELGLTRIQVQRKRDKLRYEAAQSGDSFAPDADKKAELASIPVIEAARIALDATCVQGSYYLNGKRILVGEMIRLAGNRNTTVSALVSLRLPK